MATKKTTASKPATTTKRKAAPKAKPAPARDPVKLGDLKVKPSRALSVPMVKFNPGDEYAFVTDGAMRRTLPGANTKHPAIILRSVDVVDGGALKDFICNTVLASTLERAYGAMPGDPEVEGPIPDDGNPWRGKGIIVRCSKREDKRYMDMEVQEFDPDSIGGV